MKKVINFNDQKETKNNTLVPVDTFDNPELGSLNLYRDKYGDYLFMATEVCGLLGYSNARDAIRKHTLEEDVAKYDTLTAGGVQTKTFVTEAGLYQLILSSKKPEAKKFKAWVTQVVLPSIRENGAYIAGQESMTDEELIAQALIAAQNIIESKTRQLERQQKVIETQATDLEDYDFLTSLEGLFRATDVASMFSKQWPSAQAVNGFARDVGILQKRKGNPMATKFALENDLVGGKIVNVNGVPRMNLRYTAKGVNYLRTKFRDLYGRDLPLDKNFLGGLEVKDD